MWGSEILSDAGFIDEWWFRAVCPVSGRNRRFIYLDEYAVSVKFPERLEIKIPIAHQDAVIPPSDKPGDRIPG